MLWAGCPGLELFSYKVLRINEETGLLLEPVITDGYTSTSMEADTESPAMAKTAQPLTGPVALPPLSAEEKTCFRQL